MRSETFIFLLILIPFGFITVRAIEIVYFIVPEAFIFVFTLIVYVLYYSFNWFCYIEHPGRS